MSSFFVSGPGSRCINIHCDGYPRKKIRPYTKGTASWDSFDMLLGKTCKVEGVYIVVVRKDTSLADPCRCELHFSSASRVTPS